MMLEVKVYVSETGECYLKAPYLSSFPKKARNLGGKWSSETKAWVFDGRDENRVRQLAVDFYGYGQPTVDIRYKLWPCYSKDAEGFGRVLVSRLSRDAPVKLGEGVVIIEGKFPLSGGSRNNPTLGNASPVTLEVRDVPINLIDQDDEDVEILNKIPADNPLASFSDAEILAELARRNLKILEGE